MFTLRIWPVAVGFLCAAAPSATATTTTATHWLYSAELLPLCRRVGDRLLRRRAELLGLLVCIHLFHPARQVRRRSHGLVRRAWLCRVEPRHQ